MVGNLREVDKPYPDHGGCVELSTTLLEDRVDNDDTRWHPSLFEGVGDGLA
jgi:hypothetical protein